MANAKVSFKITNDGKFVNVAPEDLVDGVLTEEQKSGLNPTYQDGQLIFVETVAEPGKGKVYLDYHNRRTCYTPEFIATTSDGLRYIGIASADPTEGAFTISGKPGYSPEENDIVVFGTKEFLYRKGEDGELGWFQLGDEETDELTWEDDV